MKRSDRNRRRRIRKIHASEQLNDVTPTTTKARQKSWRGNPFFEVGGKKTKDQTRDIQRAFVLCGGGGGGGFCKG